jgi:Uma2 family endonuclease
MEMALPKRATYDDLLAVPDHLVAQIIDGELVVLPRPASPHALAASAIGSVLFDRFHGPPGDPAAPGGWVILFEPELHLGDDVLVPDLAGWRRSRMPAVPQVAAFTLAPDWVCEVVSPKSARWDRVKKLPIYAHWAVGYVWLVDPLARLLEVLRLAGGHWVLASTHVGPAPVRAEPFDALALDARRWWREEE